MLYMYIIFLVTLLTDSYTLRSTVQFAREVSEAKAMDDTVTKLENMFTGSGASDSPVSVPRRGTSPSTKTINWGTPKQDSAMVGSYYM